MPTFTATELTSARYTATLKDETGALVGASALASMKLTLYDDVTQTIINSRDQQDVLNTHNVTLDESGNLVWLMQPADNGIVTNHRTIELHRAVFDIAWSGGRRLLHEVNIQVANIQKVLA